MKLLKHKYLIAISLVLTGLFATSCEDFLDKQEDEQLTFDKIWETRADTKRYWLNAMSFLPQEIAIWIGDSDPYTGASDEATVTFSRDYRLINFGSWNASNLPYNDSSSDRQHWRFDSMYNGIRECNIFMQNVDRCSDPIATKEELAEWKVQARFARAYYYFWMMRNWGPIYLLGDELVDFTASAENLYRPRNTWDECVNYVVSELEACVNDPAMKSSWTNNADYGLGTKGACEALIARLKLYSARPLFNGNALYSTVKNPVTDKFPELSGVNLFPEFKADKWKEAAEAAYVVINNSNYQLYRAGNGNPYEDYYGVTNVNWNKEIIWSTGYKTRQYAAQVTTPTGTPGTGYGGVGPTQQQVDAYAMSNGRYPITGYDSNGQPRVDETSGYSPNEFTIESWTYPAWGGASAYSISSPVMYKDREPRFYVNVFFSGQTWIHGTARTKISFAKGANSNTTHDYPKSGYLFNRFYDHTLNHTNSWGNMTFPTIRLAEMYLNFIEAVLECKRHNVSLPANYETRAYEVWDDLRDRAGVPPIRDVYPNATTEQLIEYCRQERRVELAFEHHRFFDTRTWMIATQTDGGPMWGMDTQGAPATGDVTPPGYWKRTVFETRIFRNNHYLYPFPQRELDRNKLLTQNYGW